jgi:hypothetical protein
MNSYIISLYELVSKPSGSAASYESFPKKNEIARRIYPETNSLLYQIFQKVLSGSKT